MLERVRDLPPRTSGTASRRRALAAEIKALTREWTSNTLALGKKLKEARDTFPTTNKSKFAPRPGWHAWLKTECGFSPQWAASLINAFEKFGSAPTEVEALGCKVMLALAKPHVPKAAREAVLARAKRGERIRARDVKNLAKATRKAETVVTAPAHTEEVTITTSPPIAAEPGTTTGATLIAALEVFLANPQATFEETHMLSALFGKLQDALRDLIATH